MKLINFKLISIKKKPIEDGFYIVYSIIHGWILGSFNINNGLPFHTLSGCHREHGICGAEEIKGVTHWAFLNDTPYGKCMPIKSKKKGKTK